MARAASNASVRYHAEKFVVNGTFSKMLAV